MNYEFMNYSLPARRLPRKNRQDAKNAKAQDR